MSLINDFINQNFFFLFILLFSFFSYIRYVYAQRNLFLLWLFFFPATFLHELAHFSVGLVTLGKPTSFNLIPKKENDSYTLGSVNFKNIMFFNALPTGAAPLLLIVGLYFLDKNNFELYKTIYFHITSIKLETFNIVSLLLLVYINYVLIYSGIPSSQDFKVIFSNKIGLVFWLLILSALFFFFFQNKLVEKVHFF